MGTSMTEMPDDRDAEQTVQPYAPTRDGQRQRWRAIKGPIQVSLIGRIRKKIRNREYYLSSHAEEEMVEDSFARVDVENAILHGRVDKRLTHDPRGTRFRLTGYALDGRVMEVLCRFRETGNLIIITVYEPEVKK